MKTIGRHRGVAMVTPSKFGKFVQCAVKCEK